MRKLLFVLALLVAAGLFALWRFIPHEDETAARLTRGAGFDLVAACNEAAEAEGAEERFTPADVHPLEKLHDGPGRVAVLASVLEARHGDLSCRWDGVEPPVLSRAQ
jgi:hypothetical protein